MRGEVDVGKRCCSSSGGVELLMQTLRCSLQCRDRSPVDGRLLTPLRKPCCSEYFYLVLLIHLVHLIHLIHFVSLVHFIYLVRFLYIRPFLVMSCFGSDTQMASQTNIIARSVSFRL